MYILYIVILFNEFRIILVLHYIKHARTSSGSDYRDTTVTVRCGHGIFIYFNACR